MHWKRKSRQKWQCKHKTDEMNRNEEIEDFETLLEENLFGEWADVLIDTNRIFNNNNMAAYIWSRAKHYALGIADSKNPVLKFRHRCNEIRNEFNYDPLETQYIFSGNPYEHRYSIVVGCVYTMIVFSAEERIAQQIIDNIPVYGTVPYCEIQNVVNAIIEKISRGEIECDYDYTKELDEDDEMSAEPVDEDNEEAQLRAYITQLESELEEKNEQLAMVANREKGISLGVNQAQAALFGLSMANAFDFDFSNKKKDLAPMLHQLFGWGKAKIESYLSTPCNKTERDELAELFKDLSPRLFATIMNWGELPPELPPLTEKLPPSEG